MSQSTWPCETRPIPQRTPSKPRAKPQRNPSATPANGEEQGPTGRLGSTRTSQPTKLPSLTLTQSSESVHARGAIARQCGDVRDR